MSKKTKITLILVSLFFLQCSEDSIDYDQKLDDTLKEAISAHSPDASIDFYILPSQLSNIPQDNKNPLTRDKVNLGKHLFFETAFATESMKASSLQSYSCSTCHIPEAGFRPNRIQGIADGGLGFGLLGEGRTMQPDYEENELDIQAARPLSMVNVAFVKNTFWNGQFGHYGANHGTEDIWDVREDTELNHLGYEAIETQNIEGLKVHRFKYDKASVDQYGYTEMFDKAFPELPEEERYNNLPASFALSAYIRSIVASEAPFQDWLRGNENAMTRDEKEGAILFFGKANCANCHYEKNLGSDEFHALGVKDMDQHPEALNKDEGARRNLGRGGFTLDNNEMFCFKVPGLYNVSDSPFYFHGASMTNLEDVIRYKARALRENIRVSQLDISPKLKKIELSDKEIDQLVLFLSNSLRDPDLLRFKPESLPSGFCFPNNDPVSRIELGCD